MAWFVVDITDATQQSKHSR